MEKRYPGPACALRDVPLLSDEPVVVNESTNTAEGRLFQFNVNSAVIARSAVNSLLVQLIVRMKGFITLPIYTYFMLPEEIGVFSLVVVTAGLLQPFFSLNMVDGPGIYFSQEKSPARIHTMYLTVVNSVFLSTLFCSALFSGFVLWTGWPALSYLPWILLLLWANTSSQLAGFLFIIYQQTTIVVRNTVQRDVGITVISILLVVLGYSYQGLLFAWIVASAVTGWLMFRLVSQEFPFSFSMDSEQAVKFLKTSLPLLPVFLFTWVIQSSDYYFLSFFHGKGVVGKYGVVYSIASIVGSLTIALNFFWYPVSARMWIDDRKKYLGLFRTIFSIFIPLLLTAVLLLEFNSRWIMTLLCRKPEYQDAYVIIGTIAFAYGMQVLITLLTAPLYSNLNVRTIFLCYLVGGVINTILNLLLIPGSGIVGAAISTAVSYLVVTVLLGYGNYKMALFPFLDRRLFAVLPLFFAGWGGSLVARGQVSLAGSLAVDLLFLSGTAFVVARWFLRPGEIEILRTIANEVQNRFRKTG